MPNNQSYGSDARKAPVKIVQNEPQPTVAAAVANSKRQVDHAK